MGHPSGISLVLQLLNGVRYTVLDKVTAVEAALVGSGYGELAAAQANLAFVPPPNGDLCK